MIFGILFLFVCYIIGSFPSALIIGKIFNKIDIRKYGSHNLGSTNAFRVLGRKQGIIVFILDSLKGMVVAISSLLLFKYYPINYKEIELFKLSFFNPYFYCVCAILGHIFPIFASFRGGKAVATSFGIALIFIPWCALLGALVFIIVLYTTGYVSLSSTISALTICITSSLQYIIFDNIEFTICLLFYTLTSIIMLRHIENFKRLLKGQENSFKKKNS